MDVWKVCEIHPSFLSGVAGVGPKSTTQKPMQIHKSLLLEKAGVQKGYSKGVVQVNRKASKPKILLQNYNFTVQSESWAIQRLDKGCRPRHTSRETRTNVGLKYTKEMKNR